MQKWIAYGVAALVGGLLTYVFAADREPSWRLVYEHTAEGEAVSGSKADLIEAVRSGTEIRVYWAGRTVEHVADSYFLTVLQGEVFAQIAPISGQKPSVDPANIELRDNKWNAVFATNGERALKWFALR